MTAWPATQATQGSVLANGGVAEFPVVHAFNGWPSDDGKTFMLEATGADGNVVRFALSVDNVKHVIAFLLVSIAPLGAATPQDDAPVGNEEIPPIPATSISVGAPNGHEGYLGISVGRAELLFSLPASVFGPLGQSLMMASASSPRPS
jgi:hypothetical protein